MDGYNYNPMYDYPVYEEPGYYYEDSGNYPYYEDKNNQEYYSIHESSPKYDGYYAFEEPHEEYYRIEENEPREFLEKENSSYSYEEPYEKQEIDDNNTHKGLPENMPYTNSHYDYPQNHESSEVIIEQYSSNYNSDYLQWCQERWDQEEYKEPGEALKPSTKEKSETKTLSDLRNKSECKHEWEVHGEVGPFQNKCYFCPNKTVQHARAKCFLCNILLCSFCIEKKFGIKIPIGIQKHIPERMVTDIPLKLPKDLTMTLTETPLHNKKSDLEIGIRQHEDDNQQDKIMTEASTSESQNQSKHLFSQQSQHDSQHDKEKIEPNDYYDNYAKNFAVLVRQLMEAISKSEDHKYCKEKEKYMKKESEATYTIIPSCFERRYWKTVNSISELISLISGDSTSPYKWNYDGWYWEKNKDYFEQPKDWKEQTGNIIRDIPDSENLKPISEEVQSTKTAKEDSSTRINQYIQEKDIPGEWDDQYIDSPDKYQIIPEEWYEEYLEEFREFLIPDNPKEQMIEDYIPPEETTTEFRRNNITTVEVKEPEVKDLKEGLTKATPKEEKAMVLGDISSEDMNIQDPGKTTLQENILISGVINKQIISKQISNQTFLRFISELRINISEFSKPGIIISKLLFCKVGVYPKVCVNIQELSEDRDKIGYSQNLVEAKIFKQVLIHQENLLILTDDQKNLLQSQNSEDIQYQDSKDINRDSGSNKRLEEDNIRSLKGDQTSEYIRSVVDYKIDDNHILGEKLLNSQSRYDLEFIQTLTDDDCEEELEYGSDIRTDIAQSSSPLSEYNHSTMFDALKNNIYDYDQNIIGENSRTKTNYSYSKHQEIVKNSIERMDKIFRRWKAETETEVLSTKNENILLISTDGFGNLILPQQAEAEIQKEKEVFGKYSLQESENFKARMTLIHRFRKDWMEKFPESIQERIYSMAAESNWQEMYDIQCRLRNEWKSSLPKSNPVFPGIEIYQDSSGLSGDLLTTVVRLDEVKDFDFIKKLYNYGMIRVLILDKRQPSFLPYEMGDVLYERKQKQSWEIFSSNTAPCYGHNFPTDRYIKISHGEIWNPDLKEFYNDWPLERKDSYYYELGNPVYYGIFGTELQLVKRLTYMTVWMKPSNNKRPFWYDYERCKRIRNNYDYIQESSTDEMARIINDDGG